MFIKQRVAFLLSCTFLSAAVCVVNPALAQDAKSDQLQRQIDSLQEQLQSLKRQVAQTKKDADKAQQTAQNAQKPPQDGQQIPPGLYDAESHMPTKAKPSSWLDTIHVSFAGSYATFDAAWRQRNEIASGSTDLPFSTLPFPNTPLYSEHELRASAQQSRIAIKMYGDINPTNHLKAYFETDFGGAAITSNSRESNSFALRIRQAFGEYDNDDWHFHMVGGQAWSLLTQNKEGMLPQNENVPLTIDAQYVVGFNWARQPQVRFVEDINKTLWFGVSVESPQASIAPNGNLPSPSSAFPFVVNAANNCNNSGFLNSATSCSNDVAPDVVEKVAWDPGWGHYEAFAVQRWFADQVSPCAHGTCETAPVVPANWSTETTFGWDVGGSVLLPVITKFLDLQGNVMYGDGGGRYGSSQLADVTYGSNGALTPLTYLSAMVGAVAHPWTGLSVYAYAGQERLNANSFGTGGYGNGLYANNGCLLENPGYANNPGGVGAASYNSAISPSVCTANVQKTQEITVGFWQDLYKGNLGELVFGAQYEYVRLTAFATNCALPGTAAACTPGPTSTPNQGLNPNNNIFFTSLRYYPF
jgi:hypothetical protein